MKISSSKSYQNNIRESGAGFTLVELLVVLTLFMLILDVTVSIFISMVHQQKRILEEQEFLNQTGYTIEYISRELRTAVQDTTGSCLSYQGDRYFGYTYVLTHYNTDKNVYNGVRFVAQDATCLEFFLDEDGILKEVKNDGVPQNILAGKFTIKDLAFIINGDKTLRAASGASQSQPRITAVLKAKMQIENSQQEKVIQTTVSNLTTNTQ